MYRRRTQAHHSEDSELWRNLFHERELRDADGAVHRESDFERDAENMRGHEAKLVRSLSGFRKSTLIRPIYPFIINNLKKGQEPSPKLLTKYTLDTDMREGGETTSGIKYPNLKIDGKYAWILLYKNEPIAIASFEAAYRTTRIVQLQGVKKNGALSNFNWAKTLVEYAIAWSNEHAVPQIAIQSAANNRHEEVRKEPRYVLTYDKTAESLLFRIDNTGEYKGDYLKKL